VNFRRGHGFGEGQLRIFDQRAPDERDEQHAQDAADDHQRGGLPVGVRRIERRPGAGHNERGQREDRAGSHRFADRTGGARDVFFQHRSLESAQHGHADDGRRIGGSDGHSRVQAEVRVGCAKDHGHHQSQQDGAQRQFLHLHVFGNEGAVLRGHIRVTG
jgi:hypothetical protein